MKKTLISLLIILLVLPLVACAQPAAAGEVKSDKPRITSPDVSPADEALLLKETAPSPLTFIRRLERRMAISFTLHTASLWLWR